MIQRISVKDPWNLYIEIEDWFMGCTMHVQDLLRDASHVLKSLDANLAMRCFGKLMHNTADRIDELMFDVRFVLEQFLAIH